MSAVGRCTGPSPATATYRIDWWLPMAGELGEWAGRWDVAPDATTARSVALAALSAEPFQRLVMLTVLAPSGRRIGRVIADSSVVECWRVADDALPPSHVDPVALPPLGREDIECLTLSRCREALLVAREGGLLDAAAVTAVVEIVQQAFAGTGPAADRAAAIAGTAMPGCDP